MRSGFVLSSPLPAAWLPAALLLASACTIAPNPATTEPGGPEPPLPPGYGTLRQEDVSLFIVSGTLQLMVTPLHESVTRVTAPDTEQRLSSLAQAYAPQVGLDREGLFLVSFYSEEPDVSFLPDEVQFISRGLRTRPRQIVPVTPGWGEQRVGQRETQMAIYSFGDGVDLESPLTLAYRFEQSNAWDVILPVVQAERSRVLARSGVDRRD